MAVDGDRDPRKVPGSRSCLGGVRITFSSSSVVRTAGGCTESVLCTRGSIAGALHRADYRLGKGAGRQLNDETRIGRERRVDGSFE